MDPSKWLDIARMVTIIGLILSLIAAIGVFYFSKKKDKNQNKELEKAKLEREQYLNQLKYIKSISIEVILTLPVLEKGYYPSYGRLYNPRKLESAPIILSKLKPDKNSVGFDMENWIEYQISKNEKELKLNYSSPTLENLIYGKGLEYFESITRIDCFIPHLIQRYEDEINKEKNIKAKVTITVNGIKSFQAEKAEYKFRKYSKSGITIIAPSKFKLIPDIVLGNKSL